MPPLDLQGYLGRKSGRSAPDEQIPAVPSAFDAMVQRLMAQENSPPAHPVREAIGRALEGFSEGVAATPETAGYNPIGGGVVGGLSALGRISARDREAQARDPRRQLLKNLTEAQARETVEEPFQIAKENRAAERDQANIELRDKLQRDRLRAAATQRAGELGIPEQAYVDAQKQAQLQLILSGKGMNDPYWPQLLEEGTLRELQRRKKFGLKGAGAVPGNLGEGSSGAQDKASVRSRLGLKP